WADRPACLRSGLPVRATGKRTRDVLFSWLYSFVLRENGNTRARGRGSRLDGHAVQGEQRTPQLEGLAFGIQHDAVVDALVVFHAFGRVRQDLISLGDGLEPRFRARRLVAVGVVAHR